jgi:hypothetical protein
MRVMRMMRVPDMLFYRGGDGALFAKTIKYHQGE